MKRFTISIGMVLGFLLSGPLGCGPRNQPSDSVPSNLTAVEGITGVKVELVAWPLKESVVGTVQSRVVTQVESKIPGKISFLQVVVGQRVRRGEILVRLDSEEIEARVAQANAQLKQEEREAERYRALLAQGAATQSEVDAVETRLTVAQGAVREAEGFRGNLEIQSTLDGVVTRKYVEQGDLALPGKPLLEIENQDEYQIVAFLPESLMSKIALDMDLLITLDAVSRPLQGSIQEISPNADPGSRTFPIKIHLPSTPELRAGLYGRVWIPLGEEQVLWVPDTALKRWGQMETLFVVQDGHALLRLVRSGKKREGFVQILSGLSDGETVIVNPPQGLKDGQKIAAL